MKSHNSSLFDNELRNSRKSLFILQMEICETICNNIEFVAQSITMTQKILNQLIKNIYKVILVKVIEHGPRLCNHICWELVTPVLDNLANKDQHSST